MQKLLSQVPGNRASILATLPRNTAAARIQAGLAQLEAGNAMGAEESFRMAMAYEPWNADAVAGIVSALIAQGRREAALQFLHQHKPALWSDDPAAAQAGLTFALELERAGDWRDAEKAYATVIAVEPKNVKALNNLAYLLSQHGGDLDDALMYANRAVAQGPDTPEVIDTLGYVHVKRGELDSALASFDSLLQKAPEHAEHLALLLASNGRGDAVRQELTAALANNDSPAARQAIQTILGKLQ
jgi:Tfp pilus assembly protein PilF